jgi:hypothetical protein
MNAERTRNLAQMHWGGSRTIGLEDLRGTLGQGWNQVGRKVLSNSLRVCLYCGNQHVRRSKKKEAFEKVFLVPLDIQCC